MKKIILNILEKAGYTVLKNDNLKIEKSGHKEDRLLRYLVKSDKPVCFDIGAHLGETIKKYQRLFNLPEIHSFEPTSNLFKNLQKKFENVTLNQIALSDSEGKATFYKQKFQNFNSLYKLRKGKNQKETVKVTTLDQYCLDKKINKIDLLKIDTQGGDTAVLRGSKNILKKTRIVMTEVTLNDAYGHHTSLKDIEDQLSDFQLYDIIKKCNYNSLADEMPQKRIPLVNKQPMRGHVSWMNVIYFNRSYF